MKKTTIVLHEQTHAFLKKLAFLRGTSISELLREATIRCYGDCGPEIEAREKAYRARIDRFFQGRAGAGDPDNGSNSADTGS